MSAHATTNINSAWGTFVRGDPLTDVPDETVAAWVTGGAAAYDLGIAPDEPPRPEDDAEEPPAPPKPRKRKGPL